MTSSIEQQALARIASKLRNAGASVPAPSLSGTIEGSIVTGLSIALALIEDELSRPTLSTIQPPSDLLTKVKN